MKMVFVHLLMFPYCIGVWSKLDKVVNAFNNA